MYQKKVKREKYNILKVFFIDQHMLYIIHKLNSDYFILVYFYVFHGEGNDARKFYISVLVTNDQTNRRFSF